MRSMDCIKTGKAIFCMHAGGMFNGEMLTNSSQAFKYWRDKGVDIFEFDICRTDNGEYVTTHNIDYNFLVEHGVKKVPKQITSEWFVTQNLSFGDKGPFNAMFLKELLYFLSEKKIKTLMLDPKDFSFDGTLLLLKYLEEHLNDLKINPTSIVVELYNPDMINASRQYPSLVTYQYCVDDDIQQGNSYITRSLSPYDIIHYLQDNNINVISYPWKQAIENLTLLKLFVDNKFIVFSRTRNNIFHEFLEKTGVSINIVDEILTKDQMNELRTYKEQYFAKYQNSITQIFK